MRRTISPRVASKSVLDGKVAQRALQSPHCNSRISEESLRQILAIHCPRMLDQFLYARVARETPAVIPAQEKNGARKIFPHACDETPVVVIARRITRAVRPIFGEAEWLFDLRDLVIAFDVLQIDEVRVLDHCFDRCGKR